MTELESTWLHDRLLGQMRWSDETWSVASKFLDAALTEAEIGELEKALLGSISRNGTRGGRIAELHHYPPTVFLGLLDLLRWRRAVMLRAKQLMDVAGQSPAAAKET